LDSNVSSDAAAAGQTIHPWPGGYFPDRRTITVGAPTPDEN
jgi:hypothetical protein